MKAELQNEMGEIELSLEEAKEYASLADSIDRLFANADWKKVIDELLLVKEAARFARAKAIVQPDEAIDRNFQKNLDNNIIMVGTFQMWLSSTLQKARLARDEVGVYENALDERRVVLAEIE